MFCRQILNAIHTISIRNSSIIIKFQFNFTQNILKYEIHIQNCF